MIRLLIILLILSCCTGCTALPAEERSFAVALCVEKEGDLWRAHGRIPTYQSGGGYLTVTGEGLNLHAALADLDAAAPMHLHLSQLRLLVLDEALGVSGVLAEVLHELSERSDLRQQCAVALTKTSASQVMEALNPTTGTRLSKTLDVLIETRVEQGVVLPATLADVVLMGERQSPVLLSLEVEDQEISLSGGYPLDGNFQPVTYLSSETMTLLAMLRGDADELRLTLLEGSAWVRDVSVKTTLSSEGAKGTVMLRLRVTDSSLSARALEEMLAAKCAALLGRLSANGSDVLGLGRKAILDAPEMKEWHAMDWPNRLRQIQWAVSVLVEEPA